jgi:hypothetical protein
MKNKLLLLLTAFFAFISTPLNAQIKEQQTTSEPKKPNQAINICAVAIPVMNVYVLNYEILLGHRHGLATRIEYAPNLKGADTKGTAWSAVLNYRCHFSPSLKGFFAGPYARYRYVYGSGTTGETDFDFTLPIANVGLNGGYRWVSKIGINAVFSWGYGYSFGKENISPSTSDTNSTFDAFKNAESKNNMLIESTFYAELSIGYAF